MHFYMEKVDRSDVGKAQANEETRSLSPIEEEPESTLRFHETFGNFTINEPKSCKTIRYPRKEYRRLGGKNDGRYKKSDSTGNNSSSEDERMERDRYRLKKVEGSYCCFRASAVSREAEASGDNDEAEIGDLHLDKYCETTVVQRLKGRVSRIEREIGALKGRRRWCQAHEMCEKLGRDMLIWREEHERRIDSQIARWQMTEERRRKHDETESTRTLYAGVQRHLDTLARRNASSRLDFRRRIDLWEKRLRRDVASLHENNLMELREQFRAWFEVQNAINSSKVQKERREVYKPGNELALEGQDGSYKSDKFEATITRDDTELLRKIKHVIRFEVQQQRDDLARRMDRKIAELWSAFEDFKHNFHLDRDHGRHNYTIAMSDDKAESVTTQDPPSDFACRESVGSDLNASSEERCVP